MSKFGEFVNVRIHAPHESIELRQHFCDVRGNFRQRAREDSEVIVLIHLEFAELSERVVVIVRIARVSAAEWEVNAAEVSMAEITSAEGVAHVAAVAIRQESRIVLRLRGLRMDAAELIFLL